MKNNVHDAARVVVLITVRVLVVSGETDSTTVFEVVLFAVRQTIR